jgi:short-subunit dehydrogenase
MTVWPWSGALVTGASSGIGEAMARQLGAAGVPTVIVARRADRLEALAAEVPGLEVLVADLLTPAGIAAVAARLADAARPVDLLVNNAGFGRSGRFVEVDADASAEQVELNVTALVRLTRAALPALVARGRGAVLNVSSVAGFQPGPGAAVYAATKAFVTSFTESLHEELRGTGVTATALCPGYTRTEFQEVSGAVDDVAKLPSFAWLAADQVARDGLRDAAAGRVLSIPGTQYKAFVAAGSVVPRTLKRRIAGWVGERV